MSRSSQALGGYFTLQGEILVLPPSGQSFSFTRSVRGTVPRAFGSQRSQRQTRRCAKAVLPLPTQKQRVTSRTDWLTTDVEVSHPDPNSASELHIPIIHIGLRRFRHGDTT
ncbi:hypothetical protein EDB92DRAFT_896778 [Lactarius akahatsu]|uniref:Uncharacterized protein n=1 Tax=Lactarius akahatsu TaxID=416441 RepID=A0AAD4LE50_9AGAM|nr:hypothetical protein EDB92DRAFT_896778 [Lactarius akahatsu]